MRNKVIILSLTLVMVLCSSFSVFGASSVVNFDWSEPAVSSEQGYLCVKTASGSSYCFMWAINPKTGDNATDAPCTSSMNLIIGPSSITFTPITTGGVSASYHITSASLNGNLKVRATGNFDSSGPSYVWDEELSEVCYYGNVGIVDNNIGSSNKWLRVNWGSDDSLNDISDMLSEVINELVTIDVDLKNVYTRLGNLNEHVDGVESALGSANTSLDNIESYLNSIKSYVDTVESKLSSLIGHVDTVESKLDDVKTKLDTVNAHLAQIEEYFIATLSYLESIDATTDSIDFHCEQIEIALKNMIDYMHGEEDTSKLDDSDINDLGSDEKEVLDDDADLIDDLSLSFGNAFDVVMDLISQAWQSNSKVFTVVIMCLTIGVLKLILNR